VPQRFRGSTCHVTSPTSLTIESSQGKKLFVFDRVFAPDVDQEGVYAYLNESVNSFMEGYNVSILAYGQSGAGKSYTMGTTGPAEQNDAQIMGTYYRRCSYATLTPSRDHAKPMQTTVDQRLTVTHRCCSACRRYTVRQAARRQVWHQIPIPIFHVTGPPTHGVFLERRREELGDECDIRRGLCTCFVLICKGNY
jgi:hypothetical protein